MALEESVWELVRSFDVVQEGFKTNSIYFSIRVGFGLLLKEIRVKVVK